MAKVTWLGEDSLHRDGAGPSNTVVGTPDSRVRFDKDKPVEVTDARLVEKLKGNRFFKVEASEPKKDK